MRRAERRADGELCEMCRRELLVTGGGDRGSVDRVLFLNYVGAGK